MGYLDSGSKPGYRRKVGEMHVTEECVQAIMYMSHFLKEMLVDVLAVGDYFLYLPIPALQMVRTP